MRSEQTKQAELVGMLMRDFGAKPVDHIAKRAAHIERRFAPNSQEPSCMNIACPGCEKEFAAQD